LYDLADQAMYSIKRNGKGAIHMLALTDPHAANQARPTRRATDRRKKSRRADNVKR
jgi:hypothetical protein